MSAPDQLVQAIIERIRERDDWKSVADMQAQIIDASARMEGHLRETLRWVREAVHQAHHEGPIEGCPKNTCDAIRQALAKGGGK